MPITYQKIGDITYVIGDRESDQMLSFLVFSSEIREEWWDGLVSEITYLIAGRLGVPVQKPGVLTDREPMKPAVYYGLWVQEGERWLYGGRWKLVSDKGKWIAVEGVAENGDALARFPRRTRMQLHRITDTRIHYQEENLVSEHHSFNVLSGEGIPPAKDAREPVTLNLRKLSSLGEPLL